MRSREGLLICVLVGFGALALATTPLAMSSQPVKGLSKSEVPRKMEKAMFGAGCFWGVEHTFRKIKGVANTAVGYAGGKTENPTYKQVCTDTTGHAEVVEVEFDPAQVSYSQLVELFFKLHDPTQLNRQGPDIGSQYRSVIFTYGPDQEKAARKAIDDLQASGKFRKPIVTQVFPAPAFYKAEEYHQRYFEKNGGPSCHIVF